MPEALDLTSTLVMGWTLPVATTERAMSRRSALPSWEGSSLTPLPRAARAVPRMAAATIAETPVQSQIFRLLLRAAKVLLPCEFWWRPEAASGTVTQVDDERFRTYLGRLISQGIKAVMQPLAFGRRTKARLYPKAVRLCPRADLWGETRTRLCQRRPRWGQAYLRSTPSTLPWMLTLVAWA